MCETTNLFDDAEDKRLFAELIIDFIENQHQEYERQHRESGCERVPLANIHFGIVRNANGSFSGIGTPNRNAGVPCLQEIAKIQGNPNEDLLITAQRMLDVFCCIGEIESSKGVYKLTKHGRLHKDLTGKLYGNTS